MNTKRLLFVITILLSICHMIGVFLGRASFPKFLGGPLFFLVVHFVLHVSFGYCIKNNDFTMIAGFNKDTNSDEMVVSVLNTVELFTGIQAVICNTLFCGIYFLESEEAKMLLFLSLFGIFLSFFIIIILVTKYKYSCKYSQSRNKH